MPTLNYGIIVFQAYSFMKEMLVINEVKKRNQKLINEGVLRRSGVQEKFQNYYASPVYKAPKSIIIPMTLIWPSKKVITAALTPVFSNQSVT